MRNAVMRESYECELSVLERIERNVLMWRVTGGKGNHREDEEIK